MNGLKELKDFQSFSKFETYEMVVESLEFWYNASLFEFQTGRQWVFDDFISEIDYKKLFYRKIFFEQMHLFN